MPRTKISEFSATPANNTDIDSINIAEGCAPSGINDAIRELMAQLKDFQTGAVGDSFNGPIGATTASTGAFTTLSASSTLGVTGVSTLTGGAVVQGLTVGRGAGAVATNTAVGASALAAVTGGYNTAFGQTAGSTITSGTENVSIGQGSMSNGAVTGDYNTTVGVSSTRNLTTGVSNSALGHASLNVITTGSYNTAIGKSALQSNTTASNNTAVGYQAGYTSTGQRNAFFGSEAGYANTTGESNTYIGRQAGNLMTSGNNNTIIGRYNGNQNGLDIRTSSNTVVLSDGDGNPVMQVESTGYTVIGYGTRGADGGLLLMGSATSGQGPCLVGYTGAYGARTARWYAGSNSFVKGGTTYDTYTVMAGSTGGVNLTNGATSWTSASDERLKDIIEPITDATNKVSQLRAVIGKYKTDEEGKRRSFLIAQDVQAVLPEAVSEGRESKEDETAYLQVSYTDVIPLLVAAIKELKAEFDAYKLTHP